MRFRIVAEEDTFGSVGSPFAIVITVDIRAKKGDLIIRVVWIGHVLMVSYSQVRCVVDVRETDTPVLEPKVERGPTMSWWFSEMKPSI